MTESGVRSPGKRESEVPTCHRTSDFEPRTLIIGFGNPLRSDDGFGWHAARALAESLDNPDVEVITCHQLTPELAERLSRCAVAVFLDAECEGTPGEIHHRELVPERLSPQAFTHTCTPAGLLASAEHLYGHRPRAYAITVTAQTFDFGEALSPVVAAALPKAVRQVGKLVGAADPKPFARGRSKLTPV
jgi:hydrogenase maturation protease